MSIEYKVSICKCPKCKDTSSIDDWDTNTITLCNRRSTRRHFKSLSCAVLNNKELTRFYICPKCGKYVQAKDIVRASNGLKS